MTPGTGATSVTVVGAGVIGLTSAIRLAEAGCSVHVMARAFSPNTTSDVAAAVWYPFHVGPRERVLKWASAAFAEFVRLLDEAPDAGVTMVEGVELFPEPATDQWWAAALPDVRRARVDELPTGYADGLVFTVPVVAMNRFQPWLRSRAEALGVQFEEATVTSLSPLLTECDVVVNCSGLGARDLASDTDLHPVRGQIVRVAPGHVHRFVQATSGPGPMAYIIPRPDCTVLGGTADANEWDLAPDPDVEASIIARCAALEPALESAAVIGRAVGLRPARSEIRLDAAPVDGGLIVHNYGHGGGGITVSWGCADEVADKVKDWRASHP